MTSLLFALEPERIVVACDSLSCTVDKLPRGFVSKIHPLPHLSTVVCGTGSASVLTHWLCTICENVVARNVDVLVELAGDQLMGIDQRLRDVYPEAAGLTSTVYHFGYSWSEKSFVGYAHRSGDGYRPERVEYGFGMKPPPENMAAAAARWLEAGPQSLVELMQQQKDDDERRPLHERVGIGGEVHVCVAEAPPFACRVQVCHEFSDASDAWNAILDRLREDGSLRAVPRAP